MYTYVYTAFFAVGFIIMMALLTTKSRKMDRTHWSIVLLMQFSNLGYIELSMAKTVEEAIIGNALLYLGGTILPAIFVVSLFQSLGFSIPYWLKHLLYTFAVSILFSVRYGSRNGLFYKDVWLEITDKSTILRYTPGIMYYVHDYYVYGLVIAVIAALLYAKKNKKKSKMIITKGYLIIVAFMVVGYAVNSLAGTVLQLIPVVYVISLVIAGVCFKLSCRYDVDEVVSSMQENSDLVHGYLLMGEDSVYLGASEKAIEMIPELDGIYIRGTSEEKPEQDAEIGKYIRRMVAGHTAGGTEEETVKLGEHYYKLVLNDCDKMRWERRGRLLFEITDITAEQEHLEFVKNYNVKLEQDVAEQTERVRELAIRDRATGVYSTYGFTLEADKRIKEGVAAEFDAYYLDIVRMGLYNRKYGDEAGDSIIRQYAKRLWEFVEEDGVVGRLGGNFFVALLRRECRENFLKLLSGVDVTVETGEGTESFQVASIAGVYEIRPEDTSPESIMTNISVAAGIAKNIQKKPVVIMTPELMQEINEQRQMLEMIPGCMERKEFKPFYQPKVNSREKVLCGAEALVRWEHEGELIAPYRFIPLLEKNEGICKLDFYMLDCVCSDLRKWIDAGLNPPVISVNFSRKNLGNPILAEEIYNVVKKYDIPVKLVQIEITETVDEYPLSYLKGVVEALQRYGLTVAIDDFGTGSSSINLIKEVSFDVLKIDKSFIDSITEKDCKILELIIAMANQIGAEVITEGAETQVQVEMLTSLGCDKIQGYYFDKPLPVGEFEKRLKAKAYA